MWGLLVISITQIDPLCNKDVRASVECRARHKHNLHNLHNLHNTSEDVSRSNYV